MDIQRKFKKLNDAVIDRQRNPATAQNRIELSRMLSEIIEFHSLVKQYTNRFSTLYNTIIFLMFGLSSIILCANLFGINTAIALHNTADAVRAIVFIPLVTVYVTFPCHFGHLVTMSAETIDESINQCCWEEFPVRVQKMQAIMMIMSQRPVYIQGVMNTKCSRESFQKIVKLAFSYFSMMRSIDG
ncbi:uncharacterized protein LOC129570304 [Sitodiplosis mosellana]|uniref:uncharacterized protein LOC129570304 n=1 Tax=Sitodiplosis mosellana TaxID=263140 RepID=UPI0024445D64|nr:uncharacterized protein LOC129570304 [Sitodiplosis mosellana]